MNLFDLTQEYMTVLQMAEDPDVDPQAVIDTMEAIEADFEDKSDSYAYIISTLKADAAGLDTEIKRLAARKNSIEANADRLKRALEAAMSLTGKTKFKTARHSFWIQKNPPSLRIDEPDRIPPQYLIPQDPKVDDDSIRKALKEGADYDWCHLEQTESLRIR